MNVVDDASDSAANDVRSLHKKSKFVGLRYVLRILMPQTGMIWSNTQAYATALAAYTPEHQGRQPPISLAELKVNRLSRSLSNSVLLSASNFSRELLPGGPSYSRYLAGLGRTRNVDRSLDNRVLTTLIVYRKRQRLESLHNMSRQRRLLFSASRTTEYGGMSATGI